MIELLRPVTCLLFAAFVTTTPDDSEAADEAAIARLRATPPLTVCGDPAPNSRSFGTSCASREFRAPALLEAPTIRWEVEFGWWGTWSPWIGEGLMLTGSCNNDTNKGLSAIDLQTGKVRWRNAAICDVGARAGTMGTANFQEAGPGKVFFALSRTDGKPADLHIIDLKTGRILEILAPWCPPILSRSASSDGMLFVGAVGVNQSEPPTRELHAFDLATGALRWKHTAQPIEEVDGQGRKHRSDDGSPMVVDGKVVIRLKDEHNYLLRALDPASGRQKMRWRSTKPAGTPSVASTAS
jgi:outer membrane protein assembly factor BamB